MTNLELEYGVNTFNLLASNSDGSESETLTIKYIPEGAETIPAPDMNLLSPANGALLNQQAFNMNLHLLSHAGPMAVTVNQTPVQLKNPKTTDAYISIPLEFGEGQHELSVAIEAIDSLGKKTQYTATFNRDSDSPEIILSTPLPEYPEKTVPSNLLSLSGQVKDSNIAGMLINQQSVVLTATEINDTYDFEAVINLPANKVVPLQLVAWDLAGNDTEIEYSLKSDFQYSIQAISPISGSQIAYDGEQVELEILARTSELVGGERVLVKVNQQEPVEINLSGTLANGEIPLSNPPGQHQIQLQLLDSTGAVSGKQDLFITLVDSSTIPLQLVSIEPENNFKYVEPNQPIELYFNKPVDLSLLKVSLKETIHGLTYINRDQPGENFLSAKGFVLEEVHKDQQSVAGSLSLLPQQTTVVFYPETYYGYKAELYLDVEYDGQSLHRGQYQVRELPTFIEGALVDQFGQPLAGIEVSIPKLNRTTVTNKDGAYAFGYQEKPEQVIPAGRYKLVANHNFKNPDFGTHSQWISVQQNRKNDNAVVKLQELARNIPFELVVPDKLNVLAQSELQIDTHNSQLYFPDGRSSGRVHIQFMNFSQISVPLYKKAMPHWLYSIQPKGIELTGDTSIKIKMAELNGSYDYLYPDMNHVLLMALDPDSQTVMPVGIGEVTDDHWVQSVGGLPAKSLDYLGYALVAPEFQTKLQDVAEGRKTLLHMLGEL